MLSKTQKSESHLPGKHVINKHEEKITNEFNFLFTNIGSDLAKKIPNMSMPFESYLTEVDKTIPTHSYNLRDQRGVFH